MLLCADCCDATNCLWELRVEGKIARLLFTNWNIYYVILHYIQIDSNSQVIDDMEGGKEIRKANFTQQEIIILIEEYRARESVLKGQLSSGVTNRERENAWREITDVINSSNPNVKRSVANIKKKWNNLTSTMKEHLCQERRETEKTGKNNLVYIYTFSYSCKNCIKIYLK